MNLTLKFPGLLFRNCEIYNENQLFASLIQKWALYQEALALYGNRRWKIKEKGFFKTKIQVFSITNQLLGETGANDNPSIWAAGKTVSNFKLGEIVFSLQEKDIPLQFAWIDNQKTQIISYDFTKTFSKQFNRTGYATIPENPKEEHPLLLLLGIFLFKLIRVPSFH